jgi:hypothetical protein
VDLTCEEDAVTGGEVLGAAASAAARTGKKVLAEDESTKAQLARLSEESAEMKAAARAYAKRVEIRQQIVLQIMRPLGRLAGFSKDYFERTFSEDLAEKLADVPDDQVQSPPPNIAVPAMQALGYSLDEPSLKEMYLNLLANASDKRQSDTSHPAFAEVIKQLSSAEARFLGQVLRAEMVPIARAKTSVPGTAGHQVRHHNLLELTDVATGQPTENPHLSAWIDNWVRLGLVERDFAHHFTDEERYAWTELRPEVTRLKDQGEVVSFDKGVLRATDFGRRFATAVGSDEKASAEAAAYRRLRETAVESDATKETGDKPEADDTARDGNAPDDL